MKSGCIRRRWSRPRIRITWTIPKQSSAHPPPPSGKSAPSPRYLRPDQLSPARSQAVHPRRSIEVPLPHRTQPRKMLYSILTRPFETRSSHQHQGPAASFPEPFTEPVPRPFPSNQAEPMSGGGETEPDTEPVA